MLSSGGPGTGQAGGFPDDNMREHPIRVHRGRGILHISNKDLWEKSRKKTRDYKAVKRLAHPKLPSIEERPAHINSREEPGHTEADLVVSRSGKKGGLLTVTERAGRYELMEKIPGPEGRYRARCLPADEAKTAGRDGD